MEKNEYRVLIKHCFLMGKNSSQTKSWLDKCYADSAKSVQMVEKWLREFKTGRTSTTDAEHSERPKEVTTEEIINKVHDIVLEDRREKVRGIEEACDISHGTVISILHEKVISKMGDAFAYNRSKTKMCTYFKGVIGHVKS